MTKTVSARQIATRTAARDRDAKRYSALTAAMSSEVEYIQDVKGRNVRVTPASDEEIAFALRGNRAIDTVELRELVGEQAIVKLIQNGSLERSSNHNKRAEYNMYWVTDRAADIYGIPATWSNDLGTFKLISTKR